MINRPYYSVRSGNNPLVKYDLTILLRLFRDLYINFLKRDYFQEAFGYYCVDNGDVPGILGIDIEAQLFRRIRKDNLYPIQNKCESYTEEDLFDIIEFLYDFVSKPIEGSGWYHEFSNCGWHDQKFEKIVGQEEYRIEINQLLQDYSTGFELSKEGNILILANEGLQDLLDLEAPSYDKENVDQKIEMAVGKYRNRHSSVNEKKDAIRDLADVLEFLRVEMNELIKNGYLVNKDESDLFELANNFGLRHHDGKQKLSYDKDIWYPWMFYYYLSTIHAVIALIKKTEINSF
jgi:hypothetical protein